MYLVGAAHPLKERTSELLRDLSTEDAVLITSAEVFQELLHRYHSIRRYAAFSQAWSTLEEMVDEVLPVTLSDVRTAGDLVLEQPTRGARDSLHVAVAIHHGIRRILTFDQGFEDYPMIEVVR